MRSEVELVRDVARHYWRFPKKMTDDAENILFSDPQRLTAACLLEFVRRLDQAISAWKWDHVASSGDINERPSNAKRFPKVRPGDRLFYCECIEDGVGEEVVVAVTKEGYARTVSLGRDDYDKWSVSWATKENYYETLAEALSDQASREIRYHQSRLAWAQKVLAAIKDGDDLTPFMDGFSEEKLAKLSSASSASATSSPSPP